ncbi:DUF2528 family protein [Flavobacterium sp. LB3P122]|uniref:DUF2528 family protein n=1 Tax=Flavobacterium algoriphilum TaxID=3398738 RepID=UPI003A8C36D2
MYFESTIIFHSETRKASFTGIGKFKKIKIMENNKGKKTYDVTHNATGGDIRVQIDFDFVWYYGDRKMTMKDTIVEMVGFWSEYETRLEANDNSYLNAFLKQLCQEVLVVSLYGNWNKDGVIDQFKNKEGWMGIDGSYGILLLDSSMMTLEEQDDYSIEELIKAKSHE